MTKKNVLIIGIIGTSILVVLTLLSITDFCYYNKICSYIFEQISPWSLANYIFFTPPILLLSLLAYKMRDEVFRAWWGFAKWWILVIIAVTLFLTNASGGGTIGMDKDFSVFILIILHFILIGVSLIKIVHAYLKYKNGDITK